jgi:hypothetical protein
LNPARDVVLNVSGISSKIYNEEGEEVVAEEVQKRRFIMKLLWD